MKYGKVIPLAGLVSADSLSLLGNQVAAVALPVLILQYTGSALASGIAVAVATLPVILAAFIGGRAIDRIGAWNVSLMSDGLSFVSVLALPLCFYYLGDVSLTLVMLLVFLGTLFDPSGVSARQTMVAGLTLRANKSLTSVNSLRGGLENAADFGGPLLAALLISYLGVMTAFYVNATSFLICAVVFVMTVPRTMDKVSPVIAADFSGFRYILRDTGLRPLAIFGLFTSFALLPFLGLFLPMLAMQKFDNIALLGISVSMFGLAATAGAVSFDWLQRRLSLTSIYYGGLVVMGCAILSCAYAVAEWQVVMVVTLGGLLLGAGNPLEQTVMQRRTPPEIAGRVFTAMTAVRYLAGPVGLVFGGVVSEFESVELAILTTGCPLVIAAIIGWWWLPLSVEPRTGD